MKIKNRHIVYRAMCIAIAILMLFTVTPMTVFAEETETKTYKTGDIIEFGSYPQSKVTDGELKAKLTELAGSTDGWTSYGYYSRNEETEQPEQGDFMKYVDVECDGAKYRGVYFTAYRPYWTIDAATEDNSNQKENGYEVNTQYWFKYGPIYWQVLSYEKETGNAVVLSKNIIDSQQYYNNNNERTIDGKTVYPNNYEHSDIRAWLNGTFYEGAFSEKEKDVIIATTLDNSAYSEEYSQYDSNSTTDKVWLLSYDEAHNADYGYDTEHWSDSETRRAQGSAYALCQGLWKSTLSGCTYWRLRSAAGGSDGSACYVDGGGFVYYGSNVDFAGYGVRPALNIHLTSEISPAEKYNVGDTVSFGSYPQSEVTDGELKAKLAELAGSTDGWTSYGYYSRSEETEQPEQGDFMKYVDVECDGEKYRGVYFTAYRPYWTNYVATEDNTNQKENGYEVNTQYWFKYEPMYWQVLSYDKETDNAVVLSKNIIDSREYYHKYDETRTDEEGKTVYPNNYEYSDIRAWLNGTFYNGAFTDAEKNAIISTTLDNKAYSEEYLQYDSNSTTDKVWLLSYDEAHNADYGFDAEHWSDSETRMAQGSAYALCQGLWKYTSNGCSYWHLRSAGDYSDSACSVDYDGYVDDYGVSNTNSGVRPALNIHLTSEISPAEKYNVGDTVSFGSYPQSEVTDGELKAKLAELAGSTDGWTSYGYYSRSEETEQPEQGDFMKYVDVECDGEKYRGVYFTAYRPYYTNGLTNEDCTNQKGNGYEVNTQYWFKYEPMYWQVLSYDKETGNAVVLSKDIIDSQQYYYDWSGTRTIDGKTVYPNNYEHSDIRAWLNGTFYNGAFSEKEKNAIISTTLDNKAYSEEYLQYDSNSTTDKVWLLSYDEAYGFETEHWSNSETRMAQGSAYALCQGLYKEYSNVCSDWRLRSADCFEPSIAYNVGYDGDVSISGVDRTFGGVRPALNIHLTSEISPACEHTWQEETTLPTCTKGGYTNHFCTKCSASYKDNYTNALGHDWDYTNVKVIKAATCTEPGEDEYTCKRCHETHIRYSSYADHDWGEWVVTTPATVDNYGVKTRKCKNCDATDTETIEKLTVSEITVNKNADNVKNFEGFVAAVPGVGADKIIAATGGSTKIYKDGKEVVFDEKTKPATGMQIVILSGDTVVLSCDIVVMGDIDCNGEISVGDARLALRAAVGLDVISGAVQAAASISHGLDEAVGVSDARLILRAAVSLDNPSDWMKNK